MSFTEREKAAETALRHLNKTLYKKLSADIRIDLYGKDVLTWSENEKIGMWSDVVDRNGDGRGKVFHV